MNWLLGRCVSDHMFVSGIILVSSVVEWYNRISPKILPHRAIRFANSASLERYRHPPKKI